MRRVLLLTALVAQCSTFILRTPRPISLTPQNRVLFASTPGDTEANADADFARMQAEIDAIIAATAPAAMSPTSSSGTNPNHISPPQGSSADSPLVKRAAAVISALLASLVFFVQHNTADVQGVALMRKMEAESPSLAKAVCNGRPTLVEFFAPWCVSCREMAPTMRALELQYADRVNFVAVDGSSEANEKLG